jgi:hypothetical protein
VHKAPLVKGGEVARQRRLLLAAAFEIIEREIRQAPVRHRAQVGDGDRSVEVAPGIESTPRSSTEDRRGGCGCAARYPPRPHQRSRANSGGQCGEHNPRPPPWRPCKPH